MSDARENSEAAASALEALARQRGVPLSRHGSHTWFFNEAPFRFICLWMKGTAVGYALHGRVLLLPREFADSAGAFRGWWYEAGVLPDLERAFEFVRAWLLDGTEVDQLPVPERDRRRCRID